MDNILNTLRMIKLEEAKSSLRSSLQCYYEDGSDDSFDKHRKIIKEIIKQIEDELQ